MHFKEFSHGIIACLTDGKLRIGREKMSIFKGSNRLKFAGVVQSLSRKCELLDIAFNLPVAVAGKFDLSRIVIPASKGSNS